MLSPALKLLVLKTRQLERLREFYQVLGIELAEERHGKGPLHYAARVGETVFEVYPLPDGVAADPTTRLGFAVADVERVICALEAVGTHIISPAGQTPWGYRAVVEDPDGRAVELYQH